MPTPKKQKLSRQEIIQACLALGDQASIEEIAASLKVSPLSVVPYISHGSDVWSLLYTHIDNYVEQHQDFDDEDSVHDRLLELILLRLEALTPFKGALRQRYESRSAGLLSTVRMIFSQTVMHLINKAYDSNQSLPAFKRPVVHVGLTGIYLATLHQWFKDESPDMADTMRFLDVRLTQLEKLQRGDVGVKDIVGGFLSNLKAS